MLSFFSEKECDLIHLLRWALIGLLYKPGIIDNYEAFGGMTIGRENLPQCHFIHHKYHTILSLIEPGPPL
jgi:hypothetical protein